MGLHKQLLLGSAAVIAGAVGAQAADLPSRKAAPVQYVRICDAYGAGFFYIPGTDTCLRVGGYVRAEYHYNPGRSIISEATGAVSQVAKDQDSTGMEMRGRINVDARTQTNWGTVQTVVHLRGSNTDGVRTSTATSNFSSGYAPVGNGSSSLTMERAYIRFAGFTAGVSSENFSTMPSYMYTGNIYAGFPNGIKQLAYTATFGGGWSATLAIESRGDFNFAKNVTSGSTAPSAVPTQVSGNYVNQPDTGYNLVGNVRLDQPWGYAQLSGMIGNNSVGNNGSYLQSSNNLLAGPKTYGSYALGFAFRINLPMIAPGDQFNFMTAYAHGADGLILSQSASSLSDASVKRFLGGVIRLDSNLTPTQVDSSGHVLSYGSENTWGVWGMLTHYWAPDWRSNWAGGMAHFSPPTAHCSTVSAGACVQNGGLNTQWGKGTILETNANLIWSPTKNFDIGIEAEYMHLKSSLQNPSANFIAAGQPGLSEDGFVYVLRLERSF